MRYTSLGNGFIVDTTGFETIAKAVGTVVTNHLTVIGEPRPEKRSPETYPLACSAAAQVLKKALFPPKTAEWGIYRGRRAERFHSVRFDSFKSENLNIDNKIKINTNLETCISETVGVILDEQIPQRLSGEARNDLKRDIVKDIAGKFRGQCRTVRNQRLNRRFKKWNVDTEIKKWYKAESKHNTQN
jgi:hypothetical protein